MGESTEPVYTKTESRAGIASRGFDVEVPSGGTITSPFDGKVKAVGKMRGFPGTLVILEKEGGKDNVVITGLPDNLSLTVGQPLLSGEPIAQGDFGKGSKITVEQRLNGKVTSGSTKALESLIKDGRFTIAGTGIEDMGALDGSGPTPEPPEVLNTWDFKLDEFDDTPSPPPPAPLPVFRPPQRQPVYDDPVHDPGPAATDESEYHSGWARGGLVR